MGYMHYWNFKPVKRGQAKQTAEVFPICRECGSASIGEVFAGDGGLTGCEGCGAVEQGYRYVNLIQYEAAN